MVLLLVAVGVLLAVFRGDTGAHGPSTGLQASTVLKVQFPSSVEGAPLQPSETSLLTSQLANLASRVPALALSTQVQYHQVGGADIFIAGGPLPAALRYKGNAQQVSLLNQILHQVGGPKARRPEGWGPMPTGTLGGQMWCGTQSVGGGTIGLCYVVDSQNVLMITTFGDSPQTTAERVRPLVEVRAN
ncbi:MAG TPA: hypothetical protein VME70_01365 [Mycobacteriales bacterium]|nr:hypothetical protein [Mycobacteriales bacterium]